MVRKAAVPEETIVASMTHSELSDKLADALQDNPRTTSAMMANLEQILQPTRSELFFSSVAILVEGLEDIAYIFTYLRLSGEWNRFRELGCHFIDCGGKTTLSRPLAIANGLGIPAFVVFDADGDDASKSAEKKKAHVRDNSCILRLCGLTDLEPLPEEPLWGRNVTMWPRKIGDSVKESVGSTEWQTACETVRKEQDLEGVKQKDAYLIGMVLDRLWNESKRIDVLESVCDHLLRFAQDSVGRATAKAAS